MNFVANRTACLIVVFLGTAALAWWFRSRSVPPLAFEPSNAQLITGIPEGTEARVPLKLVNRSRHPVRITSSNGSCACMSVLTAVNKPLGGGVVVPPKSSIPVEVTIATASLSGTRKESIAVEAVANGRTVHTVGHCTISILAGLRSEPFELVLRDVGKDPIRETIKIADGYNDPGVQISELRPSHPSLSASLEPVEDPQDLPGGLKHRYNVHVVVRPNDTQSIEQHYVDVIPTNGVKPLRVSIICHKKRPKMYLEPDVLIMPRSQSAEKVIRHVKVYSEGGRLDHLRVVSKPAFVNAEFLEKDEHSIMLRVEWVPTDVIAETSEPADVVIGIRNETGDFCSLRLFPEPLSES